MQVKIKKTDIDAVKYVATLHGYTVKFAPTDRQGIYYVRITKEITAELAWHLGREIELHLQKLESDERLRQLDQGTNNVLYTVEQIEDLP
jgi:hypothetical protein